MYAKKSLGQNFLMHRQTAARIVAAAKLAKGAFVLEIGPGTGMLTKELLDAGMQVLAIEADHTLIDGLKERFVSEIELGTLQIVHADIRTYDMLSTALPYHVVANIPYYITGEIIRQFLTAQHQPVSMTLLVQKEVAERIVRSKKESILSLSVKVYGKPEYAFTVPRGAFLPIPNVDSAVLRIADISKESFDTADREATFFILVRTGFAHKRKRLAKNLEARYTKEDISAAFSSAALGENVRSEDLSLGTWMVLNRAMEPSAETEN
jgi:16S rRNA (adenine1518-N6/adenine1519-N6)-dimethyltransferase